MFYIPVLRSTALNTGIILKRNIIHKRRYIMKIFSRLADLFKGKHQ